MHSSNGQDYSHNFNKKQPFGDAPDLPIQRVFYFIHMNDTELTVFYISEIRSKICSIIDEIQRGNELQVFNDCEYIQSQLDFIEHLTNRKAVLNGSTAKR